MTRPRRLRNDSVQSPLETYLREINETPLLSAEEEKELAYRIRERSDSEARDQMVRANLRLVVNIARSYTGKGLGLQDLIEEGNPEPGLIQLENLGRGRARGLEAEGLSAWCHTGGYHYPPVTVTGSVRGDIVHLDRVIGVGEIAISDHRSSQLTLEELVKLAGFSTSWFVRALVGTVRFRSVAGRNAGARIVESRSGAPVRAS